MAAFGKFALTDVADVTVKRLYKKLLEEGYAPVTITLVHTLLSSVFMLAESPGVELLTDTVGPPLSFDSACGIHKKLQTVL
jgi:hypothetical protein